ncbi:MAG TPA: chromate resistance protein [Myxococcota bacterium]|nr:chromate resistance protein [Myxococcota bacterium]
MSGVDQPRDWLLLLLHVPARPDYLRVKIGRRMQRIGALTIKNGVYVLPDAGEPHEDLAWVAREVTDAGGEGFMARARWVAGLTDDALVERFRRARDEAIAPWLAEARALRDAVEVTAAQVERVRRGVAEVAALDWFGSADVLEAQRLCKELTTPAPTHEVLDTARWRGRTWVTRASVKVDRMACAWAIRRFVDPDARFRFVLPGEAAMADEVTFDLIDATFGHEDGGCSLETLIRRFGLEEPGLRALAELVHDVDCKDGRYGRAEAPGLALAVEGIAATTPADLERIAKASVWFDAWLAALARGA